MTDRSDIPERFSRVGGEPLVETRPRPLLRALKLLKRYIKRLITALGKRNRWFRNAYRAGLERKHRRNYRHHYVTGGVQDQMVVFESYQARTYSCSPKALFQAMRRDPRFEGFRFVWAFKRPLEYLDHPDMAGVELVRYRSQDYFRAYAQAKYWVSNSRLPAQIEPKPEQVYVQTWHGTPLKKIGCDLLDSRNALYSNDEIFRQYSREGERFTLLLSPSRFASEKFVTSFNLERLGRGETIFESGYPRNDFMYTYTDADLARIRAELDLPEGKKVILYAPTWRDDQHKTGVGYTYDVAADFEEMRSELGDEYVILFRAHYFVANEFDFDRHEGFVRDVSHVDDINELYVVSDALITDYSSVFFDYGNLRRPIVFYMYDIDTYASELRGFYLDLDELPGPIARTQAELIDALRTMGDPDPALTARYAAFSKRFTYLDDGHSSERVLDRMLLEGSARKSAPSSSE